MTEPKRFLKI